MITFMTSPDESSGLILHVTETSLTLTPYCLGGEVDGEEFSPLLAGRLVRLGGAMSVTLDDLRRRPEWKDYCAWAVAMQPDTLRLTPFFNRTALTLTSRMRPNDFASAFGIPIRFILFVPHRDALFTDMGMSTLVHPDCPLICNIPAVEGDALAAMAAVMPRLRLSGPDQAPADGMIECAVTAICPDSDETYPHPLELELDHVNGYLPVTRLRTGQTPTSFKVRALDMRPEQSIKVKAGFRFWEAGTEKEIAVV